MKLFVVHVYLCVMGHTHLDVDQKQFCEYHDGLEEGYGMPSDCLMKGQLLAKKYIRSDLRVTEIGCKREGQK